MPLVTVGKQEEFLGKLKLKAIVVKLALEELRSLDVSINRLLLELDRVDIENILLRHSRVIFCTLSFAGQQRMENIRATTLIVDEAAQATEAETLIPFSLQPRKCLLVGDVNQLPAVVTSEVAKVNHYDWSMMHRLQNEAKFPFQLLNVQYRMDPQIRAWPSQQFYDDALQDAPDIRRRPRINLPPQLAPYSFLQVRGKEVTAYSSKRNEEESAIVVHCVQYLAKHRICTTDELGIITFYSFQVEQINADLSTAKIVDPRAQTVDGFQGEEKDIIIISFVRSNREKGVGFLSDFRRLNVALTRAKRALIMIGDSSTLSQDKTLASMLQHIVRHKNIFKSSVVMADVFQSKTRDSALLMEEMARQLFSVSVSRPAGLEEEEEARLE